MTKSPKTSHFFLARIDNLLIQRDVYYFLDYLRIIAGGRKGDGALTLYLDVIWLLNFFFDSLLLFLTAIILKRNTKKKKIFFAGFIGSLIIWAPLFSFTSVLTTPVGKILTSAMMILIAFGYHSFRTFLTNLFTFYLCTFAAGGALFGIHYMLQSNDQAGYAFVTATVSGFGDPISWLFILLGFPLVLYLSKGTFDKIETVKIHYDQIVDVSVYIKDEVVQLKGLVDSGNHLYDPITKKPIMIVTLKKTASLFPEELLKVFQDVNHLVHLDDTFYLQWNITIVPYRVVGRDNQILAAIRPEKVEIFHNQELLETDQVLVAFVDQQLSEDQSFDCIIHPKMIHQARVKHVS